MKKTIYGLLVLCAACFAFTSCSDDEDNNLGTHSEQPGVASAGVYTGTWTECSSDGVPTANADLPGTLEISNGPTAYTAIVKGYCSALASVTGEQQVNCVWMEDNFKYATTIQSGTLDATTIDGVCENGVMNLNVQKNVTIYVNNRPRTTVYIYKFTGTK